MKNKTHLPIIACACLLGALIFECHPAFSQSSSNEEAKVKQASGDEAAIDVLDVNNMDILDVLKLISQKSRRNIIAGKNVKGRVTVFLKDIGVIQTLKIISEAYGWAYVEEGDVIKIMDAADFEAKKGHKFGREMQTAIKQVIFAKAQDVAGILKEIKSPQGKVIVDENSNSLILIDEPGTIIQMANIIQKLDLPTATKVYSLNYAQADQITGNLQELITPGVGSIRKDERTNKVIITDTPEKIAEMSRVIAAFDQKHKVVLIEAKILQVALSDEYKLGVDWEGIVSDWHSFNLVSDFDVLASSDKRGSLGIGTLADDDYTFLVEALETIGETRILSSPRIATINNQEAKILVGSTEPYVTTTTTTPSAGPTTTAESVNFIDVGVKLFVTPQIHNDGFITMKINPEVSSVTRNLTTSNNNTIPVVETAEAETTVTIKDGVTVVIGGLIKEEKLKSEKKVPVISSIPLLGHAFRNIDDSDTKTEIVIFLSPKIITGDADAEASLSHLPQ